MPLANLIEDLITDLRIPGLMWQVAALLLAIALGWLAGRQLRQRISERGGLLGERADSFAYVVGPLVVTLLLLLAKLILARWYHVNLLRVAMPVFGSLAVIRFGFFLLRRLFVRNGVVSQGLQTFGKVFQLLVWLAYALYITDLWDDIYRFLEDTVIPLGKHEVTIAAVLQGGISVVLLLLLALWAGAALEERLMHLQSMHTSLRAVMARTARALLIVVAVLLSLSMVGIDLTVLSVFGGALGVGLGLGLQKIASNYVSGFIILLDRSLAIGDVITVDKYTGQVTQIKSRYTVLQGLDGVESVVPNEMLIASPVQNSSLSARGVLLSTKVGVAYNTDVEAVLPLMEQAALTVARVSREKPPSAILQGFGADGLDLQMFFWIDDPENGRAGVTSDVNRAIWKAFKQHGVSVPFPQREVRVLNPQAGPIA